MFVRVLDCERTTIWVVLRGTLLWLGIRGQMAGDLVVSGHFGLYRVPLGDREVDLTMVVMAP